MVQLDLDNIYLQITNLDESDEKKIWNILSFPLQIYGMTEIRYRHLYNRKTKKTYAGLLPYVVEYLDKEGIEYQVNDNRLKPQQDGNFKLVDYIDDKKAIPFKLRPYQQEIVDNCNEREIIQACTGAGKTCVLAALIAKFNVKPVCIFADKIGLCMQLKSEMEKFLGVEVGLVGDGVKDYKDITVISAQSAEEDYIKNANLVMWDECLPYNEKIMMANGEYRKIGEIVDELSVNNKTVQVMSYNTLTEQFEQKQITNFGKTPIEHRKLVKITIRTTSGCIEFTCTDNHKIWIDSEHEYLMAKDLELFDVVVVCKNNERLFGCVEFVEYIQDDTKEVYDLTVADNHNFIVNDIVVSNCHHIPAETITSIANQCSNAYYRIGVSATPWRDTGDDLLIEAVLSKQHKESQINASKLIELGYLVKPDIYFVPIKQTFKGKNYQSVYSQAVVLNDYRNRVIYKIAEKMYEKGKHILILFRQIAHGTEIMLKLQERLVDKATSITIKHPKSGKETTVRVKEVEMLSGNDDALKRAAVFEAVKRGICRCLVASTIADEGLDLPILDTLILAGGGKSSTRAFQRVGRVLRLHENKERAIVFDFIDYTPMLRRHSRERQKYYEREPLWDIHKFVVDPDS
jgi:type III restriction enzyme, res subunit